MKQYALVHGVCGIWEATQTTRLLRRPWRCPQTQTNVKPRDDTSFRLTTQMTCGTTTWMTAQATWSTQRSASSLSSSTCPTTGESTESCWLTWDQLGNCNMGLPSFVHVLGGSCYIRCPWHNHRRTSYNPCTTWRNSVTSSPQCTTAIMRSWHRRLLNALVSQTQDSDSYDADKDDLKEWMDKNVNFISWLEELPNY